MMKITQALQSAESMLYYIKGHCWQEIVADVSQMCQIPVENLLKTPMGGYSKGGSSGAYLYVVRDLCDHVDDYIWLYDRLHDAMSRYVLWKLLSYRLLPACAYISAAAERQYQQYFDPEIVSCDVDEVFVDCGGFTGDSAKAFMNEYKNYKKIYIFEPSKANCSICKRNLSDCLDVEIVSSGVSNRNGHAQFTISGSSSSLMSDGAETEEISITTLDDAIKEPVSFIKMDIEGAELDALEGAKYHIIHDRPKLAVCVYHLVSDLWEIPRVIDGMLKDCVLFLRHYRADQPWETVLYAIPKEKLPKEEVRTVSGDDKLSIYTFSAFPLRNVQLLKDRMVIPYIFYQHFGKSMTIVTRREEDYSNIVYLEGAELDYIEYSDSEPDGYRDAHLHYLLRNYKNIDILFLYGLYPQYASLAVLYKQLRPDGKIYMKMDANASWMDRIEVTHPVYTSLLSASDIISCESKKLQCLLSKKWPWRIEYIPNGYYDFVSMGGENVSWDAKENTILTVGRIGTRQKNNELLLEAFAKATVLNEHGWKVRLVGEVQPEFFDWIRQYFDRYPHLERQIELTGSISDRKELFEAYKKAKIFVLTSRWEGFPNVFSEAAICGCVPIVTEMDASDDMTDRGKVGAVVLQEDVDDLVKALVEICTDEERMERDCLAVQQYVGRFFDYNKIVERLELLFCLN